MTCGAIDSGMVERGGHHRSSLVEDMMMAVSVKWLPWGGPPEEDIFVAFGLPRSDFYRRLWRYVDLGAGRSHTDAAAVRQLCQDSLTKRDVPLG